MDEEKKEQQNPDEIPELYRGLKNVPLKVLDAIIVLCIAALVIVLAVGVMNR